MPAASFLKSVYLRWFSKPASQRSVYSLIRRHKIGTIVELGVGDTVRAQRMIQIAQRYHEGDVRYAGIDLFEGRDAGDSVVTLKDAYKSLRASGAKVQLIPGDPFTSLARSANGLTGTELLVVSSDLDEQSLARAWFYIPRMLCEGAHVLIERCSDQDQAIRLQKLSRFEIETLAGENDQRKRAA